MTDAFLFDRAAILAGVARLDEVLGDRGVPHQSLVVVGGSYLALIDLREATHDVDTISRLDAAFRQASDAVADEMGLPHGWINDNAAAFAPIGLTEEHCSVAFAGAALSILVPSPDWVFLMKLYAGRTVDKRDMVRLWPSAGLSSPGQAVERYWDAYPHAVEDEYLVDYVAEIAAQAV
jgi:hypothetical protein